MAHLYQIYPFFFSKCSTSSLFLSPFLRFHSCDAGRSQLPCGGVGTLSLYAVKGPYLLTLELGKTQSLVQQEASVMFEAKTYLAQEPQEEYGKWIYSVFFWHPNKKISSSHTNSNLQVVLVTVFPLPCNKGFRFGFRGNMNYCIHSNSRPCTY